MKSVIEAEQFTSRSASRLTIFVLAFVCLLVPMVLWAFASPLGSIPDEATHATRAASVVRAQLVPPALAENTDLGEVYVPEYVADMYAQSCYLFKPAVTPNQCVPAYTSTQIVKSVTTAGTNYPLFYWLVGLPTLFMNGLPALYGMRIVSAILCSLSFATLFVQLTKWKKNRWVLTLATAAITPMVIYLGGSMNPNGLEAISSATLLVVLISYCKLDEHEHKERWLTAAVALAILMLLLSAKSFALLWVLIIVIGLAIYLDKSDWRRIFSFRSSWALTVGSALIVLFAALWAKQPFPYTVKDSVPVSSIKAAFNMALRTFDFWPDYVGTFGWLDTSSPVLSYTVWGTIGISAAVISLIWGKGGARRLLLFFAMCLFIVPTAVSAFLAPKVGYIWQGRYMLAVVMMIFIASGIVISQLKTGPLTKQFQLLIRIGFAAIVLGQLVSFIWVLKRYVVGSDVAFSHMWTNPSWEPPGSTVFLILIFTISVLISYILLSKLILGTKSSVS